MWDRTPRLKDWLPRIVGAPNTPLFRAAGVRLILGMVARVLYPGTKYDLCLVLEGEQGCGKSSLARLLASGPGDAYFEDAPGLIAMDNKTRGELLAGRWLVELAELSGMARTETEGVKAFLTQTSDQYRPAYAESRRGPASQVRVHRHHERRHVPARRHRKPALRPGPLQSIDLAAFKAERDQLFAEAIAFWKGWHARR